MKILSEIISSRQNKTLIWAASLGEKKYREEYQSFTADGYKLFEEAVKSAAEISHIFVMESKAEQFMPDIKRLLSAEKYEDTSVITVKDTCFDKLTKENSPQGIITVIKYLDKIKNIIKIYKVDDYIQCNDRVMILSSLRDPSNIGAIMRSAAAFGIDTLILSADCADVYQPKTVRAAMGALFRLNILICSDLPETVKVLRECDRRVLAAELREGAESLTDISLSPRDIVIIGNEGHGISHELSCACSMSIYIPISSMTESLNAAVAASVFLWEMRNRF